MSILFYHFVTSFNYSPKRLVYIIMIC